MPKRVAAFAPEYITLLLRAAGERLEIPLPTRAACISLRSKLHQLRKAMRSEDPERALIMDVAVCREPLAGLDDTWILVVEPRTATTDEAAAFEALGITATLEAELPFTSLSDTTSESSADDALDSFLEEKPE